jgi:hypothetical protein
MRYPRLIAGLAALVLAAGLRGVVTIDHLRVR